MMSRSHIEHEVRDTSRLSYADLKEWGLGDAQHEVYGVIKANADAGNFLTDREIARTLGYSDPNKVRPRRFELMTFGLIEEAGKRRCSVSHKLAITWKTKGGQEKLFTLQQDGSLVQTRNLTHNDWLKLKEIMRNLGIEYAGQRKWRKKQ